MNHKRLEELFEAWRDGALTEDQARELNRELRESPEARKIFKAQAQLHGVLHCAVMAASVEEVAEILSRGGTRRLVHFSLPKPWLAAAAGMVFGLFGASVLWGMVMPMNKMQVRQLLWQGFEDTGLHVERGFPSRTGFWGGDRVQVVNSESAAEGHRVMRFGPAEKRRFSYVNGMVDVTGLGRDGRSERTELRLTARVRTVHGNHLTNRYRVRLAAFAEDATAVKAQWFSGGEVSDRALSFASRVVDVNQEGWVAIEAALPLPEGSRNLVISIGAATLGPTGFHVEYELDALRLELVTVRGDIRDKTESYLGVFQKENSRS